MVVVVVGTVDELVGQDCAAMPTQMVVVVAGGGNVRQAGGHLTIGVVLRTAAPAPVGPPPTRTSVATRTSNTHAVAVTIAGSQWRLPFRTWWRHR